MIYLRSRGFKYLWVLYFIAVITGLIQVFIGIRQVVAISTILTPFTLNIITRQAMIHYAQSSRKWDWTAGLIVLVLGITAIVTSEITTNLGCLQFNIQPNCGLGGKAANRFGLIFATVIAVLWNGVVEVLFWKEKI